MLTLLGSWRRFLALALVGVLTASLGAVMTRSAEAANTAPASVSLDSITSLVTAPIGTPVDAQPTVLAVPGTKLTVEVSFRDSSGYPASFTKDTSLVVTSNRGTVTPINTVALKGEQISYLTVSIPAPANQVTLTVTVPDGKLPLSDGADGIQLFDVVSHLRLNETTSGTNFQRGIGGEGGGLDGDAECAQATPTKPVCGIVFLPQGASGSDVLLSLGPCAPRVPNDLTYTDTYSRCGDPRGSVLQVLADLPLAPADNLSADKGYSRTSPATMLVKCDKTLCGGGSIQSKVLNFTRGGNDNLVKVDPCPGKGVVGVGQPACVDYVQSKRDGSGDTFLYLLFAKDARVSVR